MQIDKQKQFNDIVLLIKQAQGKAIKAVNKQLIYPKPSIGTNNHFRQRKMK